MYLFIKERTYPFVLLFFQAGKKKNLLGPVGERIRVVVLNAGSNETHGLAKMGGGELDEKECLLLSSLCSALCLYRINKILQSSNVDTMVYFGLFSLNEFKNFLRRS